MTWAAERAGGAGMTPTPPFYTILAYVLLFAVITTHLKTRAQLWRLLGAIVVMGTLVSGYQGPLSAGALRKFLKSSFPAASRWQ